MSKPFKPRGGGDPRNSTSWQKVGGWYDKSVGESGLYHHQRLVLPGALRLLGLGAGSSLIDLACGQGVLARALPPGVEYWGVDLAPALIESAKRQDRDPRHRYSVGDATKPLPLPVGHFTHAAIVLALQNMDPGQAAIANAAKHLRAGGRLAIVLNHPCFRIPRQSSWEIDARNKQQFRRVNRYLSPLKIPIRTHPSAGEKSPVTMSFHHPISDYTRWLADAGLRVERMEEWASDKTSEGPAARMENLSRAEIPLFLAVLAAKSQDSVGPMSGMK